MIELDEVDRMYAAFDILESDEKRFWKEIAPDLPPRAIEELLYIRGMESTEVWEI